MFKILGLTLIILVVAYFIIAALVKLLFKARRLENEEAKWQTQKTRELEEAAHSFRREADRLNKAKEEI